MAASASFLKSPLDGTKVTPLHIVVMRMCLSTYCTWASYDVDKLVAHVCCLGAVSHSNQRDAGAAEPGETDDDVQRLPEQMSGDGRGEKRLS